MDAEQDKTTGPGRLLQLLLSAALLLGLVRWMRGDELVTVDRATALAGRVTRCDVNRQHFNWYLNGQPVRYDFWAFEPADTATKRLITADSLAFIVATGDSSGYTYYNTLAYYLRPGARLRKTANSPYITVEQNHRRTRWQYRP